MEFKTLIFRQINNHTGGGMRQKRTTQVSIFEAFAAPDIGCELEMMSQWLDGRRQVCDWVHEDLRS